MKIAAAALFESGVALAAILLRVYTYVQLLRSELMKKVSRAEEIERKRKRM